MNLLVSGKKIGEQTELIFLLNWFLKGEAGPVAQKVFLAWLNGAFFYGRNSALGGSSNFNRRDILDFKMGKKHWQAGLKKAILKLKGGHHLGN